MTHSVEPWLLLCVTAAATAAGCAVLLGTRTARYVGAPGNNPFHAAGARKAVVGLVPILVALALSVVAAGDSRWACYTLVAIATLAAIGARDDARPLSPAQKVLLQLPVIAFTTYFLAPFEEPETPYQRAFAHCAHSLFLLITVNALNVLDVADGLAPSVAAISLGAASVLLLAVGARDAALVSVCFAGAIVGFIGFNTAGVAILGDSGSLALGGVLGIIVPLAARPASPVGSATLIILLLLLPLTEVVWLSAKRSVRGIRPWTASPHHLVYCLAARSFRQKAATALLVTVQALAGVIALWLSPHGVDWPLLGCFAVTFPLCIYLGLAYRPWVAGRAGNTSNRADVRPGH